MYPPPQTFFYDETPPSSPQHVELPSFQLSPASDGDKGKKLHRRGHGQSEKSKPKHSPPFSYEYVVKEGQLVGMAEFHPDSDYLHYSSSSRGSSRVPSRNPSTNPSPRTSTAERRSGEVDYSMPPPPSPKRSDKLKRALSLSHLKGRPNVEDKKRRAPFVPSPQQTSTSTIASVGAQHATRSREPVTTLTPPRTPKVSFEEPRPAPQPPSNKPSHATRQPSSSSSPKQLAKESAAINIQVGVASSATTESNIPEWSKAKSNKRSAKRPTGLKLRTAAVEAVHGSAGIEQSPAPRPPLQRKTSKFVEHFDTTPSQVHEHKGAPPVPSSQPLDFQKQPEPNASATRSTARSKQPTAITIHPEWPNSSEPKFLAGRQDLKAGPFPAPAQLLQPRYNLNIAPKRSASNMKPTPTRVAVPASILKRAATTRSRPPALWGDVCMAEVKPVLMGPVVASGHARMISC